MNKPKTFIIATLALASLSVMSSVEAQQQQPQQAAPQLPQAPNMTFFVVSAGPGKGGDLGGLEGADQHCQQLAQRHGAGGKTWRAAKLVIVAVQIVDGLSDDFAFEILPRTVANAVTLLRAMIN